MYEKEEGIIAVVEKEKLIIPEKPIRLSVYFDFDQSDIKTGEWKKLDDFLVKLKNRKNIKIQLRAYCDFRGTDNYNIVLSNKRALVIYGFLIANGISRERITYVGLGEINDGQPRWMNRRVDLVVE